MFTNEGEVHHRLHSLVQQAFVPRPVEALRPFTAEVAAEILAPIAATGRGNLAELALEHRLPVLERSWLDGAAGSTGAHPSCYDSTWDPDPSDVDDAEATMLAVAAHEIDEAALAEWLRERVRFA